MASRTESTRLAKEYVPETAIGVQRPWNATTLGTMREIQALRHAPAGIKKQCTTPECATWHRRAQAVSRPKAKAHSEKYPRSRQAAGKRRQGPGQSEMEYEQLVQATATHGSTPSLNRCGATMEAAAATVREKLRRLPDQPAKKAGVRTSPRRSLSAEVLQGPRGQDSTASADIIHAGHEPSGSTIYRGQLNQRSPPHRRGR